MKLSRRAVLASSLAAPGAAVLARTASAATPPRYPGFTDTVGGGAGPVIRVTSLASRGPGTLREALGRKGPRRILFDVAGIIDLERSTIGIHEPFVTVDGLSGPAPGITIIRGGLRIATHDVILRHLRIRAGADGAARNSGWEVDGINTHAAHDVVVEHCSLAWATDENLTASGPRFAGGDTPEEWRANTSRRISFLDNIVAEGLSKSSHSKGEHSKGTLIHDNVTEVLIAGNLYAHNYERNPLFKGGVRAVAANNLIYDPGNRLMNYGLLEKEWVGRRPVTGELAIVGNVARGGVSTRADLPFLHMAGIGALDLYMADNLAHYADGKPMPEMAFQRGATASVNRLVRPPLWPRGFTAKPASSVERDVLANAGARPRERDAVDRRIVANVRSGGGRIIDDEREVGGYPRAAG